MILLERQSFERELEQLGVGSTRLDRVDEEWSDLVAADTVDTDAAQPIFPAKVTARMEKLLDAAALANAVTWNRAQHPRVSEVGATALLARLRQYLDVPAIERAIAADKALAPRAGDADALLAVCTHQLQQKIYASLPAKNAGKLGEGTLDALGFVRHRGGALNSVDVSNVAYHTGTDGKGESEAYKRIKAVYRATPTVFQSLGTDVQPKTWYCLFTTPPFLGRTFGNGIHLELLRRLRRGERWLMQQRQYRDLDPVELGRALGIDENHGGGRMKEKTGASMHTFGLAVDIGYVANPWVAGQAGSPNRNAAFIAVSKNVSRLLSGTDEALTPRWLSSLGTDASIGTEAAYDEIQKRHMSFLVYMGLAKDLAALKTTIARRSNGMNPHLVIATGETVDQAVRRWAGTIQSDIVRLRKALGGRDPAKGFLNLSRDLVIALRDHGCLAWGGTDLGTRQSGDMMHFDCRAAGIGRAVRPDSAHAVTQGHPCLGRADAEQEDVTTSAATTPTPTAHRGGQLWSFQSAALPRLDVAVFVPKAAAHAKSLEVILFAHGLNVCGPVKSRPKSGVDFVTGPVFELGAIVDDAKRPMVLVVPFLSWETLAKKKLGFTLPAGQEKKDRQHRLGQPATMNAVIAEVLASIGRVAGTAAPALSRFVLAGHSRAYDLLDPLALAHADPAMTSGALAKLSHVWAFDTTYSSRPAAYEKWLASKPALSLDVFYREGSGTAGGGKALEKVARTSGGRMAVKVAMECHCDVPGMRLPGRLASLP